MCDGFHHGIHHFVLKRSEHNRPVLHGEPRHTVDVVDFALANLFNLCYSDHVSVSPGARALEILVQSIKKRLAQFRSEIAWVQLDGFFKIDLSIWMTMMMMKYWC